MKALKEKYLRPGRKITDQFVLATGLSVLIMAAAEIFLPIGALLLGSFERILGGNHEAAVERATRKTAIENAG